MFLNAKINLAHQVLIILQKLKGKENSFAPFAIFTLFAKIEVKPLEQ